MTLTREEAAVKLARKSYPSFTKTVVENFSGDTIKAFADVPVMIVPVMIVTVIVQMTTQ